MYIFIFFSVVFIVLLLSTKKPAIAFSFLLCMYGFEQWLQYRDYFFVVNTSLVNITSGLVALYALSVKVKKDKNIFRNIPLEAVLVMLLYIYASISVLWSPVPDISIENLFFYAPYIVLMVFISPFLIQHETDAYDAFIFLVMFGGIILILLLFSNWGYRAIVLESAAMRIQMNPLALANLAACVMLVSVLMSMRQPSKVWNIIRMAIVVISLAIVVKTGSRGQFIFVLITVLLFLPVSLPAQTARKIVPFIFSFIFIACAAYWMASELIQGDARWEISYISRDIDGRFNSASILLDHWYDTPGSILFGLGSSASYDPNILSFYSHVVPLEILGELGVIGFFLFILVLYLSYKNFKVSLNKIGKDKFGKGVIVALASLVCLHFLISFKQGSFLGSDFLFGMLVVFAIYNKNIRKDIPRVDNIKKIDTVGSVIYKRSSLP